MGMALVVLGAFAVSVNIAFGGTDHLPEIRSWLCLTIGVGILILMRRRSASLIENLALRRYYIRVPKP
jgi:hypothetical protein